MSNPRDVASLRYQIEYHEDELRRNAKDIERLENMIKQEQEAPRKSSVSSKSEPSSDVMTLGKRLEYFMKEKEAINAWLEVSRMAVGACQRLLISRSDSLVTGETGSMQSNYKRDFQRVSYPLWFPCMYCSLPRSDCPP